VSGSWLGLETSVAIVTGGALGIGRACCESLVRNGAKVVVTDMDPVTGEATVLALRRLVGVAGGDAIFIKTDVRDSSQVKAMVAIAVKTFGKVDILVNNAGVNIPRLLVDPAGKEELTEEIWDTLTDINQKGVYLCAQAVARWMVNAKHPGVIINMTSESGMEGSEGQGAYAAGKAALYGLTRSWAKELGRHGIRMVGVAPGILEATGLRSEKYENALAYTRGIKVEDLRAGYEKVSIPLGRVGKLSEVADLVTYLASERSSYVHGTVINISGGKSRA
jgi:sorbitol-6-phosphate 2-dehydrogenase